MAPTHIWWLRFLSVVDHNTLRFRGMRNFDTESLSNDQIVCDILNCDDDYGGDDDDDDGDNDGDDMVIYHACGENLHKLSYGHKKIWPGTRRQPLELAKTIIVLDIPENEFSRHFANNGKNPNLKNLDEVFFLVETFIKYSYFSIRKEMW